MNQTYQQLQYQRAMKEWEKDNQRFEAHQRRLRSIRNVRLCMYAAALVLLAAYVISFWLFAAAAAAMAGGFLAVVLANGNKIEKSFCNINPKRGKESGYDDCGLSMGMDAYGDRCDNFCCNDGLAYDAADSQTPIEAGNQTQPPDAAAIG